MYSYTLHFKYTKITKDTKRTKVQIENKFFVVFMTLREARDLGGWVTIPLSWYALGSICIHLYIFVFIVCFGEYMCTHVFICIHDIFWVVYIYTHVHICLSVLRYACGCVCVCTCVHVWCFASGCFGRIAAAATRNICIYIYSPRVWSWPCGARQLS